MLQGPSFIGLNKNLIKKVTNNDVALLDVLVYIEIDERIQ